MAESEGKMTFYGKDPIVPSCLRSGSMAAVTLAAKAVAAAGIWKFRSGEDKIFMSMYVRRCGGLEHSSNLNGS